MSTQDPKIYGPKEPDTIKSYCWTCDDNTEDLETNFETVRSIPARAIVVEVWCKVCGEVKHVKKCAES